MADTKTTALSVGAVIVSGDPIVYVDISDTTQAASGSLKQLDIDILVTFMEDNMEFSGEVTGLDANSLILDKLAITNKSTIVPVSGDFILFSDTSDSGNLKKLNVSTLLGGAGTTINPTDLNLPVRSDSNTFVDSLLRQTATSGELVSDAELIIYKAPTVSEADSIGLLVEADGTLVWTGLTGGLLAVIDDKDNELWTASDVSGNPIGFINADWLVQFGNPFNRPFQLVYNNTTGDTDWFFNAVRYNMLQLVDFADDTSAGVGGLATGDLYRTTSTKAIAVKD